MNIYVNLFLQKFIQKELLLRQHLQRLADVADCHSLTGQRNLSLYEKFKVKSRPSLS